MTTAASRGFTLIELVVALALSLTLVFGVGYAYVHHRSDVRSQRELVQIQSEVQWALQQIGADIRQAGFVGCNSNLARAPLKQSTEVEVVSRTAANAPSLSAEDVLRVWNSGDPDTPANADKDSHILEVRFADSEGAAMLKAPLAISPSGETTITTGLGNAYTNQFALLSDCAGGVVVPISKSAKTLSAPPTGATRPVARTYSVESTSPVALDNTLCGNPSNVGTDCVYWPSAALWPIRVAQYYVVNGELYVRTQTNNVSGARWNAEQLLLRGVRRFRLERVGMDGLQPNDPFTWTTTSTLDATKAMDRSFKGSWKRVNRVDLSLGMQSAAADQARTRVYRDYSASFAVRARTAPEPNP